MITVDKVIEIFCIADDFCREYSIENSIKNLFSFLCNYKISQPPLMIPLFFVLTGHKRKQAIQYSTRLKIVTLHYGQRYL